MTNALTGEPVKKAHLRFTAADRPGTSGSRGMPSQQGYAVITEADASFSIERIEPGRYNLSGQRNGLLNISYGAKGPRQLRSSIVLARSQNLFGAIQNPQNASGTKQPISAQVLVVPEPLNRGRSGSTVVNTGTAGLSKRGISHRAATASTL